MAGALAAITAIAVGLAGWLLAVRDQPPRTVQPPRPAPPTAPRVPIRPALPPFRPTGRAVEHGPRDRREVAITFDADMTPSMLASIRSGRVASAYDERIARTLRRTRTPATIFMTGLWARTYPEAARSFARDPLFEVANHSFEHRAFSQPCYGLPAITGERAKRADIAGAAETIERITGERPRWFRFPGGCHDPSDARLVASLGEQAVQWDVPSGDAYLRDPGAVTRTTLELTRSGSIVVMHLNGAPNAPATAEALPEVIAGLRERGLRPVTLGTMLGPRAPTADPR